MDQQPVCPLPVVEADRLPGSGVLVGDDYAADGHPEADRLDPALAAAGVPPVAGEACHLDSVLVDTGVPLVAGDVGLDPAPEDVLRPAAVDARLAAGEACRLGSGLVAADVPAAEEAGFLRADLAAAVAGDRRSAEEACRPEPDLVVVGEAHAGEAVGLAPDPGAVVRPAVAVGLPESDLAEQLACPRFLVWVVFDFPLHRSPHPEKDAKSGERVLTGKADLRAFFPRLLQKPVVRKYHLWFLVVPVRVVALYCLYLVLSVVF